MTEINVIKYAFLVILHAIWDSYIVNVLSKQYYHLNEIDYIVVENKITKIDYEELKSKKDQSIFLKYSLSTS